jgi:hypothetical protein
MAWIRSEENARDRCLGAAESRFCVLRFCDINRDARE